MRRALKYVVFGLPIVVVAFIWGGRIAGEWMQPSLLESMAPPSQRDFCELLETTRDRWAVAADYSAHPGPQAEARRHILEWRDGVVASSVPGGRVDRWVGVLFREDGGALGDGPLGLRIEVTGCGSFVAADDGRASAIELGTPIVFSGRLIEVPAPGRGFVESNRVYGDEIQSIMEPRFHSTLDEIAPLVEDHAESLRQRR